MMRTIVAAVCVFGVLGLARAQAVEVCTSGESCQYLPLAMGGEALLGVETPVVTQSPAPTATITPSPTRDPSRCDPAYPSVCIPPPPPDLDCGDIPYRDFTVLPPDPHDFDRDGDGVGCEG